MRKTLVFLVACIPIISLAQTVFINEIHYDNGGTDTNEAIELAGTAGTDLAGWSLVLYNGSNGSAYSTTTLTGVFTDSSNGFGFITTSYPTNGIQNGAPDGIALVDAAGIVVQFLSYEGNFAAVGGPADGLTSEDIGVSESGGTTGNQSMQLTGEGTTYQDFTWTSNLSSTFDGLNVNQVLGTATPVVFVNEIHYDNSGADTNEAIELAGNAGTDLAGWSLVLYNGSNGSAYSTTTLTGVFDNEANGFGFISFAIAGIQNGAPDGIALVDAAGSVIQFLSYEGDFTAVDGPADSLQSTDIGISEPGNTPIGSSLQLTGAGESFEDFTWIAATNTFDAINEGQTFGDVIDPQPVDINLFINEIHYDNAGGDINEGIEVAGVAGTDLTGWTLQLYNGNGGALYNTTSLTGIIADQQNGFGTAFFPISGIQNGGPDGVALVSPDDSVLLFLSYEGSFTATSGTANGLTSEDIGVSEAGATPVGFSLQLEGEGSVYTDFTWAAPGASTYDAINTNQSFGLTAPIAFINEIHYDNAGSDQNEAIEVAGTAGLDLSGWSLVLYNGNGGTAYRTEALSGTLPDQDNGFGTLFFTISGIQNGAPDGVALVAPGDSVVQLLSYEGSFTAADGPAIGVVSEDIGVSESGGTPVGFSLQLEGTGQLYTDFFWTDAQANTFGAVNTNQSFGGVIVTPPTSDTVTLAQARTLPLNTEVVVQAVLTVADEFGGPAYLQDATGGIALFDSQVHGEGAYHIGDELLIKASIGEFSNQIQLVNVDTIVLIDSNVVVTPTVITLDQLASFEGQLVTIENVSFDVANGVLFPNTNYDISDSTSTQEVRIDGSTDLVGRERPNGVTSITGVIGRFQSFVQLLPRFIPDLPGSSPFTPGGSDLPFDQTLDVATWNMEFFGTTINGFGPSNVTLQAENALTVLSSLNADIIALQEVSNDSLLMAVLDSLPGYELICSDVFSRSFETPDPNNPFPPQKLCYIYNTAVVTVVEDRVVFDEFYTQARTGVINDLDGYPTSSGASSFWSSGRLPYQLIADVTFSGSTERVNLINVHGKSGSSANDLARKVFDNTVLKDSMDAQYGSDRLIVLGDYNDDVTTSIGGGPSSYEVIIGDTLNYRAITRSLSEANIPTFIGGSGSTIDHITISNELFSDLVPGSETIYFPFNDISNFEGTTSDHLPVIARFEVVPPLDPLTSSISETQTVFSGYAPQATATLEVTPSGGLAPYSFEWNTGDTTSVINVTPEDTAIFTVLITDAAGNQLSDTTQVNVVDVACQSWGRTKVQVCFRGRSLCVPEFMATRLLAKGATLGECNPVCDVARVRNIRAWPNPFRNKLKVSLECSESVSVNLSVKRLFTRKEVFNQTTTFEAGNSDVILDLGHLQRGFYVLVVRNESTGEIEKIIRLCKY